MTAPSILRWTTLVWPHLYTAPWGRTAGALPADRRLLLPPGYAHLFLPVPKDELDRLQEFFPNSAAISNRDAFDYLYRAEDLKYFRGKKLSGQRNHVNKFLKPTATGPSG